MILFWILYCVTVVSISPDGLPRQLIEGDVSDLLDIYLAQTPEERAAEPDTDALGWEDEDDDVGVDPPDTDGGNYGEFEN